jgi:hypothetical protein
LKEFSMAAITVNASAKIVAPQGASLPATLFACLAGWFRHASVARTQAPRYSERAADAARVRRYAQQVMSYDPRFAADLFAAADRHERGR